MTRNDSSNRFSSVGVATSAELLLAVPTEHACYADHFPGNPLVPGALLLKWILALIEHEFCCNVLLLKNIKFLRPVKPGDNLKITATVNYPLTQVAMTVYVRESVVMKGSLGCGDPENCEYK